MKATTDLVLVDQVTALQLFSIEGGLDPIIEEAREYVASFDHDLTTAAGRKRTASLAAKVAKLKVRIDDMGKELVSDWKAKSKLVDASRKVMRDSLDSLKAEARKPLTDWEEEQAAIEAEKAAQKEREAVEKEIAEAHELALLIDEKFDRDREDARLAAEQAAKAEAERIEKERIEYEERIKADAAERARLAAEQAAEAERAKVEQEKKAAERREIEAALRAEEAERQRIAAEERAKAEAEQAVINARLEVEQAVKREQARVEAEKKAEAEAAAKREKNKQHMAAINRAAVASIVESTSLTEVQAKEVVIAIAKRQVAGVSIYY